jgi:hypothetical protein
MNNKQIIDAQVNKSRRDYIDHAITMRDQTHPIAKLVYALAELADNYRARYRSGIVSDGYMGDHWTGVFDSCRALLNGDTGNLVCGLVDTILNDMAKREGYDE